MAARGLRRVEMRRLEDIRHKMRAAEVIQRAWRRFKADSSVRARTSAQVTSPAVRPSPVPSPARPSPGATMHAVAPVPAVMHVPPPPRRAKGRQDFSHIDASNPKHQIAALTIQLAWRRYTRRLAVRARAHRGLALLFARRARRRVQQEQAYAPMPLAELWHPVLVPVIRPPELMLPSPAITSFNMAFDTYLTPLLHPARMEEKRNRTTDLSRRAKTVRDHILEMRRLHGSHEGSPEPAPLLVTPRHAAVHA